MKQYTHVRYVIVTSTSQTGSLNSHNNNHLMATLLLAKGREGYPLQTKRSVVYSKFTMATTDSKHVHTAVNSEELWNWIPQTELVHRVQWAFPM